jgi:hypothetical protein
MKKEIDTLKDENRTLKLKNEEIIRETSSKIIENKELKENLELLT